MGEASTWWIVRIIAWPLVHHDQPNGQYSFLLSRQQISMDGQRGNIKQYASSSMVGGAVQQPSRLPAGSASTGATNGEARPHVHPVYVPPWQARILRSRSKVVSYYPSYYETERLSQSHPSDVLAQSTIIHFILLPIFSATHALLPLLHPPSSFIESRSPHLSWRTNPNTNFLPLKLPSSPPSPSKQKQKHTVWPSPSFITISLSKTILSLVSSPTPND